MVYIQVTRCKVGGMFEPARRRLLYFHLLMDRIAKAKEKLAAVLQLYCSYDTYAWSGYSMVCGREIIVLIVCS
jgi:hypothetical protein